MDREPATGGGSDTILIDPGVPFEHGADPEPEKKPAEKSESDKRIEALEAEIASERKKRELAEDDARYWSRRNNQPAPTPRNDEEEQPRRRQAAAPPPEKPEKVVDDLNTEGLQALKKRGVITQDELDERLAAQGEEIEARIRAERADAELGMKIQREFPDIYDESQKMSADPSYRPKSPLLIRAGQIYREAVADDPKLKGSQGLLLSAARQAKRELELEARSRRDDGDDPPPRRESRNDRNEREDRDDRQQRRRENIDRQRDRGRGSDDLAAGEHHTAEQLAVMKNLKVKPDEFARHREGRRNGR